MHLFFFLALHFWSHSSACHASKIVSRQLVGLVPETYFPNFASILKLLQRHKNRLSGSRYNVHYTHVKTTLILQEEWYAAGLPSSSQCSCVSKHSELSSWQVFGSTSHYWKAFFICRLLDDKHLAWKRMLFKRFFFFLLLFTHTHPFFSQNWLLLIFFLSFR